MKRHRSRAAVRRIGRALAAVAASCLLILAGCGGDNLSIPGGGVETPGTPGAPTETPTFPGGVPTPTPTPMEAAKIEP